jgi:hypothetical protein
MYCRKELIVNSHSRVSVNALETSVQCTAAVTNHCIVTSISEHEEKALNSVLLGGAETLIDQVEDGGNHRSDHQTE